MKKNRQGQVAARVVDGMDKVLSDGSLKTTSDSGLAIHKAIADADGTLNGLPQAADARA